MIHQEQTIFKDEFWKDIRGHFKEKFGDNFYTEDLLIHIEDESFPSTCGPHNGVGGQAFTNFKVVTVQLYDVRLLMCGGLTKWIKVDGLESRTDYSWTRNHRKNEKVDWSIYG